MTYKVLSRSELGGTVPVASNDSGIQSNTAKCDHGKSTTNTSADTSSVTCLTRYPTHQSSAFTNKRHASLTETPYSINHWLGGKPNDGPTIERFIYLLAREANEPSDSTHAMAIRNIENHELCGVGMWVVNGIWGNELSGFETLELFEG